MGYKLKTQVNNTNVIDVLHAIEDDSKREQALQLLQLFQEVSGETPEMWGESIIGFGRYHYTYASGQQGDWMRTGFAPRKNWFSLYIMPGYQFDSMKPLLNALGKHTLGKSCLSIKKLTDIDENILKNIISEWLKIMEAKYPTQ